MRTSFITTVYNEEKTIDKFLESLKNQTKLPDEIIVVDGGSTDNTLSIISNSQFPIPNKRIKILEKRGNRSVGRNEAIKNATGDIIVCSDSGNVLDKNWIKNIIKPFRDPSSHKASKGLSKSVDVVAGYYKGVAKNIFQKCLIPYVLVMPDKVNSETFLPATRSIAFTKSIWKKVGGFPEKYSHNEDFVFAKKLKETKAKIVFAKDAIVNWIPRNNLKEAFVMFFRFAYGDAEAGIIRPKVVLIYIRYILWLFLLKFAIFLNSQLLLTTCYLLLATYLVWAIKKNYKYVKEKPAFYFLPILQLCADIAVISASFLGGLKRLRNVIYNNKSTTAIIIIYTALLLSVINWGIPNQNHPYTYHMDEWHQFMSVKSVYQHGTPNIEGAAHGPLFQFLLSGAYLVPFVLSGFVQLDLLKENLMAQNTLFIILRTNTLLFGILSLIVISKIAKDFLKVPAFIPVLFFATTPIWLSLSNYFKYDIALIFWMLLALFFMLKFYATKTKKSYVLAGVATGLALATKISALPLFIIFLFSFLFFQENKIKRYKIFILGIFAFTITFLALGIPDVILGIANYGNFFSSNLQDVPKESTNIILGKSYWLYLLIDQYLLIFGHIFYTLALLTIAYWIIYYLKDLKRISQERIPFFFLISFGLFALSLIPLKLFATGNRSLVLLPFFCFLLTLFLKRIYNYLSKTTKGIFICVIIILFSLQAIEAISWIAIKWNPDPQEVSSQWILKNVPEKSSIGIEIIPIYQYLPDIVVKEFYADNKRSNKYLYTVFENKPTSYPDYIIATNYDILTNFFKNPPNKNVIDILAKQGYHQVAAFYPNQLSFKDLNDPLGFYLSNTVPMRSVTIYKK
jgi:glycosyltransferase involved in cell wall biosynthesis